MTAHDLTDTYRSLIALKKSVEALTQFADLMPSEDEHASLIAVLSDRIDTDFCALSGELTRLTRLKSVNTPS